jgi:hypothetical protein
MANESKSAQGDVLHYLLQTTAGIAMISFLSVSFWAGVTGEPVHTGANLVQNLLEAVAFFALRQRSLVRGDYRPSIELLRRLGELCLLANGSGLALFYTLGCLSCL